MNSRNYDELSEEMMINALATLVKSKEKEAEYYAGQHDRACDFQYLLLDMLKYNGLIEELKERVKESDQENISSHLEYLNDCYS